MNQPLPTPPAGSWTALIRELEVLSTTSQDSLAVGAARRVLATLAHHGIRDPELGPDGRYGNWMWTHSGAHFYPVDPRPEEVHLDDIIWSLSYLNRYGGHASAPYSVLTHSMLVADLAGELLLLRGETPTPLFLRRAHFHDAPEAYIEDVRKPLKPHLWGYSAIEERISRVIGARFGMGAGLANLDPAIKDADLLAAILEARVLCGNPRDWAFPEVLPSVMPLLVNDRIVIETPLEARLRFRGRLQDMGLPE